MAPCFSKCSPDADPRAHIFRSNLLRSTVQGCRSRDQPLWTARLGGCWLTRADSVVHCHLPCHRQLGRTGIPTFALPSRRRGAELVILCLARDGLMIQHCLAR